MITLCLPPFTLTFALRKLRLRRRQEFAQCTSLMKSMQAGTCVSQSSAGKRATLLSHKWAHSERESNARNSARLFLLLPLSFPSLSPSSSSKQVFQNTLNKNGLCLLSLINWDYVSFQRWELDFTIWWYQRIGIKFQQMGQVRKYGPCQADYLWQGEKKYF